MQEQVAQAVAKYHAAFNAATTDAERQAARDEYERDVNEAIRGERKTTKELVEALR